MRGTAQHSIRNLYRKAISPGPIRPVTDQGALQCNHCGKVHDIVISEWVKQDCPPTDLNPLDSLHWQATFDGWVIAPTSIIMGGELVDWTIAWCPSCADGQLAHAARLRDLGLEARRNGRGSCL